jgi:hypothetical protein
MHSTFALLAPHTKPYKAGRERKKDGHGTRLLNSTQTWMGETHEHTTTRSNGQRAEVENKTEGDVDGREASEEEEVGRTKEDRDSERKRSREGRIECERFTDTIHRESGERRW